MRSVILVLLAAALGASSAFLVACGDRNALIPRSDAQAINSDLDEASSLYAREECRAAQGRVIAAQSRADELPGDVDSDLTSTLKDNLAGVLARIRSQCGKRTDTQTQTTQTTETTPPTTTETTPTTDETETTPTTDETEPPPTTPPEGGDEDGGSSGGTPSGLRRKGRKKDKD